MKENNTGKCNVTSFVIFMTIFITISAAFLFFMPKSGEFRGNPEGKLISYPPDGSDTIALVSALIIIIFIILFQIFFMKHLKGWKRPTATILMVILFFGYTELALGLYSKNYRVPNKPHPTLLWTRDDIPLNSHGLDSAEFPTRKDTGEFRIIIAGDSSAAGQGVDKQGRFSALLENRLKEKYPGKNIRVINAAFPGYSIFQIKNLTKQTLLTLSPDLLILAVNNDTEDSHAQDKNVVPPENLAFLMNPLYRSKLYLLFRKNMVNREFKANMEKRKPLEIRVSPEDRENAYKEIIAGVKNKGGKVLIIAMPSRFNKCPRFDRDKEYKEELGKLAKRENTYFLDLYHQWKSKDSEPLFTGGEDYIHPNGKGHEEIAGSIFELIVKENIIDKTE
jgi:lysophospholipase L1-like esterase